MLADLALLRVLIARMAGGSTDMRRALRLGLAEEGVSLSLGVASPFLLRRAVERLGHASPGELAVLVTGFVFSWTAPSLIAALKLTRTASLTHGLYQQIAERVVRRELPILAAGSGPGSGHIGGVLERLPFSVQWVLDGLIWRALPLFAQLCVGLATLALTLPLRYAALLGLTFLLFLLISDLGATRLADRVARANLTTARFSARLADVVRNAVRVISNGTLGQELSGLAAFTLDRHAAQHAVARLIAATTALQTVLLISGLSLVLFTAGLDVTAHRLQPADFVLLQAFALRLALPLSSLAISVRQSAGPLANIREAIALGASDGARLPTRHFPLSGSVGIALEAVSFTYPDSTSSLRHLSFHLEPNQLVAVVGANGSGKSTLARLMAGLLQPDTGDVKVGGVSLSDIALERRPERVLYVPQFIGLFDRSLGDNGLYPPSVPHPQTLTQRLSEWNFNPDGRAADLGAMIGEHGARLSGGQIQKLELARLCAIDAPILLLDESTSALDAASEGEIVRTLRAGCAGRLLILITHRLGLAEIADQVVFLSRGRLAGMASHAELMADPRYRALWS